jgi:hypothetical protein
VADKRLLPIESEFSSTLRMLGRDGNVLSAVIREAWDSGDLRILTKNEPARATGAHISLIGHISASELRSELTTNDKANGFGNRILWVCVRRARCLPEGGQVNPSELEPLITELSEAVTFAKQVGEMHRDEDANRLWHAEYPTLSEGSPGLVGSMTARAEAQVMRLAALYALLDRSDVIRLPHLQAALALWSYCVASVRFIFRNSLGNPIADQLLDALRQRPNGMTRTEMRDLLARHATEDAIDQALNGLSEAGLARSEKQATGGRPTERWFAILPRSTDGTRP